MEAQKDKNQKNQILEPGLVISRKSYVFEIKRQFTNLKRYKVLFSDELNLDNIRIIITDALGGRGRGARKSARPPLNVKALAGKMLKYVLFFFVIGIIGLFILSLMFQPQAARKPAVQNQTLMNFNYGFVNNEVISYRSDFRAYSTIRLNETGVNSTEINMKLYYEEIPRTIVLLKSTRYEDENFPQFRNGLKRSLTDAGLDFNEIHVSQLMHVPENVSMILVAPTGRVPSSFLGVDEQKFDMRNLLASKSVIIYIGYSFDSGAISENGTVYSNVAPLLKRFNIQFERFGGSALTGGFTMQRPDYVIKNSKVVHGGVSILSYKPGYLVTFPNTLRGWTNGTNAAKDVYSIIKNLEWLSPISSARPKLIGNSDKNSSLDMTVTLFSDPYSTRADLTAQFQISANGFGGTNVTKIEYVQFPLIAKGTMNHQDEILPTNICLRKDDEGKEVSCELYMTVDFNESVQRTEMMKVVAYRDDIMVSENRIGEKSTLLKNEKVSYPVELDPGNYVLKIEDDTGYVYAQSYLHVPKIELRRKSFNYERGTFDFFVLSDGGSLGRNYNVRNVFVSLDRQQNKSLTSRKDKDNTVVSYSFSGAIPEGEHYMYITVGNQMSRLKDNFVKRREWWDNPIYQGMLLIGILVFAVAYFIKRPESIILQLDVPDFPPLSKTKIPVSREQACQIFDIVNSDYRWKFMPLKHGEIKNGFRRISYKGRPILVSDYNLERVLDQLEEEGLVRKSMQFYGLNEWEPKSGKSLDYLAVFRSLRDALLNMSIRFTELGERTDCDMLASANERYYLHVYQGDETIQRAVFTLQKGKSVIVFKDSDSLESFKKNLCSTDRAHLLVKLYVGNESLFLATPEGIERIVT